MPCHGRSCAEGHLIISEGLRYFREPDVYSECLKNSLIIPNMMYITVIRRRRTAIRRCALLLKPFLKFGMIRHILFDTLQDRMEPNAKMLIVWFQHVRFSFTILHRLLTCKQLRLSFYRF